MKTWHLIGLLIAAFAFVNLLWTYVLGVRVPARNGHELETSLFVGCFFAQFGLISIWGILGVGPLIVRLLGSLVLTLAMCGLLSKTGRIVDVIVFLSAQTCVHVLLWIPCRVFDWRLVSTTAATSRLNASHYQYSLKQLFIGMSLLAVTMSLVYTIVPSEAWHLTRVGNRILMGAIFGLAVAINVFSTLPCLRNAHRRKYRVPRRLFFFLAVVVVTSVINFFVTFPVFMWAKLSLRNWMLIVLAMSSLQCVMVASVMLLLQRVGIVWTNKGSRNRKTQELMIHAIWATQQNAEIDACSRK